MVLWLFNKIFTSPAVSNVLKHNFARKYVFDELLFTGKVFNQITSKATNSLRTWNPFPFTTPQWPWYVALCCKWGILFQLYWLPFWWGFGFCCLNRVILLESLLECVLLWAQFTNGKYWFSCFCHCFTSTAFLTSVRVFGLTMSPTRYLVANPSLCIIFSHWTI